MKTNRIKINVNALISFGGGLIILSLATKLLHFEWADKFIVSAFVLEAFLFFLMGFQKLRDNDEGNNGLSSNKETIGEVTVSEETTLNLERAILKLTHSSDANMMISQAIISDVGVDNLIAKIEGLKKYSALNITELQDVVNDNVEKFKELGETTDTLIRINLGQINAYRQTR